jgi:hypothetical protein
MPHGCALHNGPALLACSGCRAEESRHATDHLLRLQVELYAEYAPEHLMPFLQSSKAFHKDSALQVCQQRGLVPEQVFLLGRLGRHSEALQLIVSTLHDLPQAIAFVSSHGDLWDELISLVVKDRNLTGELLDQVRASTIVASHSNGGASSIHVS